MIYHIVMNIKEFYIFMVKIIKKLAILFLPVVLYFAVFIYFEPYNYFGLFEDEYAGDSAIARVRNFNLSPSDVIILGDSRLAHFDMDLVEEIVGEKVGQLAFGGASFNESLDLLEYAISENEDLHTVYFGASFYTLNESYYKDRMSQIETVSKNPLAYMFNFSYNVEMLNEILYFFKGVENVAFDHIGQWEEEDYYYEDGTKRQYRKNLEEYAVDIIYPIVENYVLDTDDIQRYISLLEICKEEGITVYTVLPPMDDSLKYLVIEELGIDEDILFFISEVSPYTQVLNYEYTQTNHFTSDEFYDGFHLDKAIGLERFTYMLFER